MTEKRLFTVADAATLISKATGADKFQVAQDISYAGQGTYRDAGESGLRDALPLYGTDGRPHRWLPPYGITSQTMEAPEGAPAEFSKAPPYCYVRVDIYEVLDAFDYHPEIQTKILAELDRPMQGAVVSNDASGPVKKWTPERVAEARAMQVRLKAEGQKAFTAQTAAHYGVSAARLREVLKAESPTTKETQQEKAGPWDVLGT